jgi:PIN domain nuclease of toxin-antitoxin system
LRKERGIWSLNRYILDSYALIAFLQQENGWKKIKELFIEASNRKTELYMSIINLAEVKYIMKRRKRLTAQMIGAIDALPIKIESADEYIEEVIDIKASFAVSLGDCFGAALAIKNACPIITSDPEFKKLELVIDVEWL